MKLAELRSETKPIVVHFDAGDLKVSYRPNAFTADAMDSVQAAAADTAKATDAMFQMVAGVLADWDLEGDDGTVIPLSDTARLRAEVPMGVFNRIFVAMNEDQNPEAAGKA